MTTPAQVIQRRVDAHAVLVEVARRFAASLPDHLEIRAVVVFGSVARGDFNDMSDIDVLVVADVLPDRVLDRNAAIGVPPTRVEYVAWTTTEWKSERDRGNPIAIEAVGTGIVVRGLLPT